ncbi:MAG TPA: UDP-3-O-[3-hydroxymyristoyl] N-acetylglucosamine deacetylase [bacterium]|nr:UDP-3-O-[3-hydroxymyristoyl] N-acetylglucosamine deacetylase [bacterium]
MKKQNTIAANVRIKGKGLHKGGENTVIFSPAPPGTGITIINSGERYVLNPHRVFDVKRGTSVKKGKSRIYTVEHMVSAVRGLGIDNIAVEIDGDEIPCIDGSAKAFVEALLKAGIKKQAAGKKAVELKEPVAVKDGESFMAVIPYPVFKVYYFADFSGFKAGTMEFSLEINPESYRKKICAARTFGFKKEMAALKRSGLIKGADLNSAVLMDKGRPVNTKLRYEDELVRHKILDITGDFGLLGAELKMLVLAFKTGHRHNIEAAKKIAARTAAAKNKSI